MIGAVELLYRRLGGGPTSVPGMTAPEFEWKVRRAVPGSVFVVGDSRVGWGFAEKQFKAALRSRGSSLTALNAGIPANAEEAIIRFIVGTQRVHPGTLIVNFSAAGFYHFSDSLTIGSTVKLQDYIDDRIRSWISQYLITSFRNPRDLYSRLAHPDRITWLSRQCFDDGFVNGRLGRDDGMPVDAEEYQFEYYTEIVHRIQGHRSGALQRKAGLENALREAQAAGWNVAIVRFPLGDHLRQLEDTLPVDLAPFTIASDVGVPYVDYTRDQRTSAFATLDGSHLAPESARKFATILAEDMESQWGIVRSSLLVPQRTSKNSN